MSVFIKLLAGYCAVPLTVQRLFARAGEPSLTQLIRGVQMHPQMAAELAGTPLSAAHMENIVTRHLTNDGLDMLLSRPERRHGVLQATLHCFIPTPAQQKRLVRLTSSNAPLQDVILHSFWADVPTVLALLAPLDFRNRISYFGTVSCSTELTDDVIWQLLTEGADSPLALSDVVPDLVVVPQGDGQLMMDLDVRPAVTRALQVSTGNEPDDRLYALAMSRLLLARPTLRERALAAGQAGSWVALLALALLPLTAGEGAPLVASMVQFWPAVTEATGCARAALYGMLGHISLPPELRATLADLADRDPEIRATIHTSGSPLRWGVPSGLDELGAAFLTLMPGSRSQYGAFQVLDVLSRANAQVQLPGFDPRWSELAERAVHILLGHRGVPNALVPAPLVARTGYEWWSSLDPTNEVQQSHAWAFHGERRRQSIRAMASSVAVSGRAVRIRELFNPNPFASRMDRVEPEELSAQKTLTLATCTKQMESSAAFTWPARAAQLGAWFVAELGEDIVLWQTVMTLAETFDGTSEQLVETARLLQ